jgi:glycerophosphoryl diester phosphodiesterase
MKKTIELLRFNWRILLIFEIVYRLIGLAIIFPVANRLLYLSVKFSGYEYLANSNLSEYLVRPSTILIFILLLLIVGLYITYEIVVLSIFFHSSYYKQKIGIYTLFWASFKKMTSVIKKYHIVIVLSSAIFFVLVEGLHVVGIASTIQLPAIIQEQLGSIKWFYPMTALFILFLLYLFMETIFFELQCTVESPNIRSNFSHSRDILKNKRIKLMLEFFSINLIINLLFYLLYFIVIGGVGILLFLIKTDNAVYPLLLTTLYTIYLIIGFFATIVLIPVNFAWINSWYYQNKTTSDQETQKSLKKIIQNKPYYNKAFDRSLKVISLVLIVLVIFIFTSVSNDPSHLELFNNPTVIAHRGGGDYGPENTISAIEMGIDLGADSVEFDVRFTKDDVPVLMHDATLGRTTNDSMNRAVNSVTLEELKELDAGSWFGEEFAGEQVPTLQEAFEAIDTRIDIFLEIKSSDNSQIPILLELIEETNTEKQIIILSFDDALLKEIKNENNDIETMLLLGSFIGDINVLVNRDHIDHYGLRYSIIESSNNKVYIRRIQESGKGVYVWTVSDEESLLELISLNVDGIITDAPLLTRQLVYSDSKRSEFTKLLERLFIRE